MLSGVLVISAMAGLLYIYIGYPVLIWLVSRIRPRPVIQGPFEPTVTILIAACNEEHQISSTIENKLDLDYSPEKLEVIVISDGSVDRTNEIVGSFSDRSVRLILQVPRAGKASALNIGVEAARGELIVISDANSIYEQDALRKLLRNFRDPEVGYVTGKMMYSNPDGSVVGDGCTAYMRYENILRTLETRVGSIVGVDGAIDAFRRATYQPMLKEQLEDFVPPSREIQQGRRVVYESEAVVRESTLSSSEDEYQMRVRVALRALWALHEMRFLLNPFRYGFYSLQVFSHKILRYVAFSLLMVALIFNLLLWGKHPFWSALLIVQVSGYGMALVACMLDHVGIRFRPFYLPYYFLLVNLASAHAALKYLAGTKQVLWTPRKG